MRVYYTGFIVGLIWAVSQQTYAFQGESPKAGRTLGIGVLAGAPDLLGAELKLLFLPRFEFDIGTGTLPINTFLQSKVALAPIALDLQLPDTFLLVPSSSYAISNVILSVKFFPFEQGFFIKAGLNWVSMSAHLVSDLKNSTLGTTLSGVATGDFALSQLFLTPALGYQIFLFSGVHLDLALGLSILFPAKYTISTGGTLTSLLALNAAATQSFETAKGQAVEQVNQAIQTYQNQVKYLPSIFLGLGFVF